MASAHGDVYHWVGAPGWTDIPPLDRVWFATEHSAQEAGYKRATSAWESLDELEILGEIGRGATSIVYHGRDRALGRDVAVKVVQAPFGTDPETEARFAQEARLLAALRHPNIVSAFAVKPLIGGGFALVMEYVRGRTLRDVLDEQGALSHERVEQVLRDVASALDAAHEHGIVHRDVKPDNVFLEDASGKALLADFGIAISVDNPSGLTMVGTAVGTPNYMSPEQIDGYRIDRRSDVYSLGLLGWEMLTGEKPWKGESLYSVIYKQKNERLPTLRRLRTDVPARLAFAIEGALAKDPAARWTGAHEFLEQLTDQSWATRWRRRTAGLKWKRRPRRSERPVAAPPVIPMVSTSARTVLIQRPEDGFVPSVPERRPTVAHGLAVSVAVAASLVLALAVAPVATGLVRESPPPPELSQATPGLASPGAGGGGSLAAPVPPALPGPLVEEPFVSTDTSAVLTASIDAAVAELLRPSDQPAGAPPPPVASGGATEAALTNELAALATAESVSRAGPLAGPAPSRPASSTVLPVARGESRIATGGMHSCGIDARQTVVCWGGNDRGQLAGARERRAPSGVLIVDATGVQSIEAGGFHSCALRALGSVICWGENSDGQLGGGSTGSAGVARVSGNRFFTLTLGLSHTCGLGRDGVAYCWGSNASGQLGDGTFTGRTTPTRVELEGGTLVSLAAGWSHSCALTREGRALCWGDNARGQLGDGTQTSRATPTSVGGGVTFAALAAGSAHTCGLSPRGTAYCWGQNGSGQLGDGTNSDRSSPVAVASSLLFAQISAGGRHTCALDREGDAYCWGQNNYGQLGNGTLESTAVPTRVATVLRFVTIRSSGSHTCAVATDGASYCWGYNVEGQVGDGTQVHRSTPQKVSR